MIYYKLYQQVKNLFQDALFGWWSCFQPVKQNNSCNYLPGDYFTRSGQTRKIM
jgi:hypothetical protein